MTQTCYYLTYEQNHPFFYSKNFSPVNSKELSGFFAFVAYENAGEFLFVLRRAINYQTNHSGISLMLQPHKTIERLNFFVEPKHHYRLSHFIKDQPKFGGEFLLFEGEIVFWNFKSRCYSLSKSDYHDNNPNLQASIQQTSLPTNRFISAKKADHFAETSLTIHFKSNGEFLIPEDASKTVVLLNTQLELVPMPSLLEEDPVTHTLICSSP
ncbi:hypothetical protein [Legionella hackeliae]|uniref:Uncharacterized protein n=1 Tax=Legionella hackeliae TaxID=449 RepID=A0A0A8UV37_LEGHA|nr:hypothetical protein [Legionella hackeliae]KTD15249.1 hypothetical protein Lhac_0091 [Legionella hackeliae]CEK11386.1 protein of unknown function [Legionella hackeliae]STX48158.1 Uncharacterised protein [Legionella hackeliae]